jgi:DNA-binding PadR family transcriptional regulator
MSTEPNYGLTDKTILVLLAFDGEKDRFSGIEISRKVFGKINNENSFGVGMSRNLQQLRDRGLVDRVFLRNGTSDNYYQLTEKGKEVLIEIRTLKEG